MAILFRLCAGVIGALLLAVALSWTSACFSLGLSGWSLAVGSGLTFLSVGLLGLALAVRVMRWSLPVGLLLLLGSPFIRMLIVHDSEQTRLTLLPGNVATRAVNTLFPEADGALAAAALLNYRGSLNDQEAPRFREILTQAYARTQPGAASMPTPAIATYLGMQTPSAFDTLVIEARAQSGAARVPVQGALIFLHGYAGNFYVYCWEAAQAAAQAHLLTVCPSTSARAAWGSEQGKQTFLSTVQYLRGRGIERIYLAGLSNGGAGASTLGLRHTKELSGLILISGVIGQRPPAIPTLVIQGAQDRMMPAAQARAYAAASPQARYRELPGGHFIFLSQHQQVRAWIGEFLQAQEHAH